MPTYTAAYMFEGVSFDTFGDFLQELFSITPYIIPAAIGYIGFRKAVQFLLDSFRSA